MYISICLLLFYVNIAFIVIRGRFFECYDSLVLITIVPTRMSFASFKNTNSTNVMSVYPQKAIQATLKIEQSVNNKNSPPRKQNPCAHGEQEFVEKAFSTQVLCSKEMYKCFFSNTLLVYEKG